MKGGKWIGGIMGGCLLGLMACSGSISSGGDTDSLTVPDTAMVDTMKSDSVLSKEMAMADSLDREEKVYKSRVGKLKELVRQRQTDLQRSDKVEPTPSAVSFDPVETQLLRALLAKRGGDIDILAIQETGSWSRASCWEVEIDRLNYLRMEEEIYGHTDKMEDLNLLLDMCERGRQESLEKTDVVLLQSQAHVVIDGERYIYGLLTDAKTGEMKDYKTGHEKLSTDVGLPSSYLSIRRRLLSE